MIRKCGLMEMLLGAALLLCGCGTSQHPHHHLVGSVSGTVYTTSRGGFSVPFPVSQDTGGVLADTPQSVVFGDNLGTRITFSSAQFNPGSSMASMLKTQGREKALSEFVRRDYGNLITIHYHPDVCDGAISFLVLQPPAAKAAVAAFVHGDRIFLARTILQPGVAWVLPSDEQSIAKQEEWLENRAVELVQSFQVK